MMKRKIGFALLLFMMIFALALASCSQPAAPRQILGAASFSMQSAPAAPPVEDQSEIGSTDGILIMGVVIVAITSLPILFHRRKKK